MRIFRRRGDSHETDGFLNLLGETCHMVGRAPSRIDSAVARVSARNQWLANACGDD
jgi:hypothetical protein